MSDDATDPRLLTGDGYLASVVARSEILTDRPVCITPGDVRRISRPVRGSRAFARTLASRAS